MGGVIVLAAPAWDRDRGSRLWLVGGAKAQVPRKGLRICFSSGRRRGDDTLAES